MRIVEILLPKGSTRSELSPKKEKDIDMLQQRMTKYFDRILDPKTPMRGREFLKNKLHSDFDEWREAVHSDDDSIDEVFEPGKKWQINQSGTHRFIADFEVENISYIFAANIKDIETNLWYIEFFADVDYEDEDPEDPESDLRYHYKKYGLTGTGNSTEVMSTVVSILRFFLVQYSVDAFNFNASEGNRQNLYQRMIKRLLPDWNIEREGNDGFLVKKKEMEIAEVFEPNENWQKVETASNRFVADFKVKDELYTFTAKKSNKPYQGDYIWLVQFAREDKDPNAVFFDPDFTDKRYGLSGTGNSVEVISKVVSIMKFFLSQYNVNGFYFAAYGDSRKNLYHSMLKRLLPDWKIEKRGEDGFIVKKEKTEVSEYREIKPVMEAVTKLPLTVEDFELVKELMKKPIPAVIAPIYITQIIEDDAFNDELRSLEETNPGLDVRPFVAEWFVRNMPDELHRFGQEVADTKQKKGILSPIHGYDLTSFNKAEHTGTGSSGDAFGMY